MYVRASHLDNTCGAGSRPRVASSTVVLLLIMFGMTGCGGASGPAATVSSPSGAASGPASSGAKSPTVATPTISGGPIGNTPCPTTSPAAADAGNPTLVLTPVSHGHVGAARVGDIVQVRLPDTSRWQYTPTEPATALVPVSPSDVFVPALHACIWSFQAVVAGGQMLRFVGQAICPPGQFCANRAVSLVFSVTIS